MISSICHGIYQVVVESFLQRGRDQKLKKPKSVVGYARTTITRATEVSAKPSQAKLLMLKKKGCLEFQRWTCNSNFTSPPPPTAFQRENLVNMHAMPDTRK
ncbi:hypothetical protein RYX36_016056 [Vicia faba]